MDSLYSILGWGSPVGTGLFLMMLGAFIFLLAKADGVKKRK